MFTPRRWQNDAIAGVDAILSANEHAYVQAPSGTGKTHFILLHGEQSAVKGFHTIIIGTDQINQQHRETFMNAGIEAVPDKIGEYVSRSTGRKWLITTWQSIAMGPEKFKRRTRCGILYFDECHLGGANANNVSYPRVVDTLRPRKRVMVSATTNVASEKLLGKRDDHIFRYGMSHAAKDRLLNPTQVIEVQTGLTAEIKRIQLVTGEPIEDIETMTDDTLAKLAVKLKEKHVATPDEIVESARKIVEYRHKAMIDLYLANHRGESAIFWSPNIDASDRAAAHFARRSRIKADTVNHTVGSEAKERIMSFREGDIKVLFACNMVQEGFNMLDLAVSFDCRFHRHINAQRIARMLQRIGRLTRKSPGKPISRYYVAPDLTHYYSARGLIQGSVLTASLLAVDDMSHGELEGSIAIPAGNEIELNRIDTDDDIESDTPGTVAGSNAAKSKGVSKVKARASSLYFIDAVRDYRETETVMLTDLFGKIGDRAKAKFKAAAKAGKAPPASRGPDKQDHQQLWHYRRNDPKFDEDMRAYPEWGRKNAPPRRMDAWKTKFLSEVKAGATLKSYNVIEQMALRRTMKSDPVFNTAILALNPKLAIQRQEKLSDHKATLEAAAKAGERRPKYRTEEYFKLLRCRTRDKAWAAMMDITYPDWKPYTGVPKATFRKRARAGKAMPLPRTPDYQSFCNLIRQDAEYKAEMEAFGWVVMTRGERNRLPKNRGKPKKK